GADDCGNGYHCDKGDKCTSGGGCIPLDAEKCPNGGYCDKGSVDCGH
ncbi:16801_t:CDS:2, partial [Funneliformis caledonium]